jgi:hypothetical protein
MSIDEAILNLQLAKHDGVENIVLAYWDAQSFEMKEGEEWASLCEQMEDNMDWSGAHDNLSEIIKEELS